MGFTQDNIDDSFKGKVSLAFVTSQVNAHKSRCESILNRVGDSFVSGAQTEILSTVEKVGKVIGTSDKARVESALIAMRESQAVLVALAAIIADAVHQNCGHIHEAIQSYIDLIHLEAHASPRSPRRK